MPFSSIDVIFDKNGPSVNFISLCETTLKVVYEKVGLNIGLHYTTKVGAGKYFFRILFFWKYRDSSFGSSTNIIDHYKDILKTRSIIKKVKMPMSIEFWKMVRL